MKCEPIIRQRLKEAKKKENYAIINLINENLYNKINVSRANYFAQTVNICIVTTIKMTNMDLTLD